jgi:hypothetical protein
VPPPRLPPGRRRPAARVPVNMAERRCAPAQVAEWAAHGVAVLLKVYAKCIDGQDAIARRRIDEALRDQDDGRER